MQIGIERNVDSLHRVPWNKVKLLGHCRISERRNPGVVPSGFLGKLNEKYCR